MWDFNIRQAIALLAKTMPFILLRLAVYFGITLAYILVTGGGAGIGWSIGHLGDEEFRASATMWGGIGGLALTSGIMYWAREYLLYLIKAGHIAVMVELIDGRPLPEGRSQIGYGTARLQHVLLRAGTVHADARTRSCQRQARALHLLREVGAEVLHGELGV